MKGNGKMFGRVDKADSPNNDFANAAARKSGVLEFKYLCGSSRTIFTGGAMCHVLVRVR